MKAVLGLAKDHGLLRVDDLVGHDDVAANRQAMHEIRAPCQIHEGCIDDPVGVLAAQLRLFLLRGLPEGRQ